MPTMTPLFYHYTPFGDAIIRDGVINVEVGPTIGNETPCVWRTAATTWEPTAWKQINGRDIHDPAEIAQAIGALYRFGIPAKLKFIRTIAQWRRESGCLKAMQHCLINVTAEQFGVNPDRDWRVSFRPLKACYWSSVECSIDGINWQEMAR
jgi:hypothetical protein